MRGFITYTLVSVATVALAFAEQGQHMGLYGFIAIFICQPWLAVIWVSLALGIPVPDLALSPILVAVLSGLNVILWGSLLFVRRRHQAKQPPRSANVAP